jgi:DNA-binding transcriptional MerR regulator
MILLYCKRQIALSAICSLQYISDKYTKGCDKVYKIGELSKLCKIPVKTLRYYDCEGLIIPDVTDKFTGYRYYSAEKLSDCNKILALKELGFSLEEIKKQMHAKAPTDILTLIKAKEAELNVLKTQTESQLRRLSAIKENITEGADPMYNVVVRSTDAIHIAFIRKIFKDKSEAYKQTDEIRDRLPPSIVGKRNVIINYETEYAENNFDLAAGVEITGILPKESSCGYSEKHIDFPSETASLVCKKSELENAYTAIQKYIQENSYQIIGAFYEIYHEDDIVELKVPVFKLKERLQNPVNDDIDIPFEDDPAVVGYWKVIDFIPTKEHFNIDKIKYNGEKIFDEFYFLPNGQRYWCFGWTKGYMLCESGDGSELQRYEIFEQNNEKYMFLEMGTGAFYESKPEYLVLKQIDSKPYTLNDIAIKDNIDYPFINDNAVLGKWKSVDLIHEISDFNADSRRWKGNLFLEYVKFEENGIYEGKYGDNVVRLPEIYKWTKGFLINKSNSLASEYSIMHIEGSDYLFLQWKSGDYVYGHRKPYYYVFKRI